MIHPKNNDAKISGVTIKKLKIPIYTPVRAGGREAASIAYGIDSVLAHAIPIPTIVSSSTYLSWITTTDINPSAPHTRQSEWVCLRPSFLAIGASTNENPKHTAE